VAEFTIKRWSGDDDYIKSSSLLEEKIRRHPSTAPGDTNLSDATAQENEARFTLIDITNDLNGSDRTTGSKAVVISANIMRGRYAECTT